MRCFKKYAFDMSAADFCLITRLSCYFLYCIQNCPTGTEDFFKSMSDMNLPGGSDGELDFIPLMQGMMQNLLSKDVLYPALKDLQEKVINTIMSRGGLPYKSDGGDRQNFGK